MQAMNAKSLFCAACAAAACTPAKADAPDGAAVSVASWRYNAKGAVSVYYDDGTDSAFEFVVPTLVRFHIPGTFYLCPGWHENAPEKLQRWGDLVATTPEVYLGNHTWGHSGAADLAQLEDEVRRGDEAVRKLMTRKPGFRQDGLLSFAIPGGVPWKVTADQLAETLASHHNALRNDFGPNIAAEPGRGFGLTDFAAARAALDRAEREGSWQSILFHGVGGDWFLFPADDHERLIREIALRQAEGRLWAAATIEVHKYAAERKAAKVSATAAEDGSLAIRLEVGTDASLYDVPLTLVAAVPAEWKSVRVAAGGRSWRVAVVDGHALIDVPPVSGDIAVKKDR